MNEATPPAPVRAMRGPILALAVALAALRLAHAADGPAPETRPESAAVPVAVSDLLRQYEKAWNAKDVNRLADLFSPDGLALPNGQAPATGRQAIADAYRQNAGGALVLRPIRYTETADMALVVGMFATGPDQPELGKFVLALRRAPAGGWSIVADMDNMNGVPRKAALSGPPR